MNLNKAIGDLELAIQDVEVSTCMVRVIDEALDYSECKSDNNAMIMSLALSYSVGMLRDATERLVCGFNDYRDLIGTGLDVE